MIGGKPKAAESTVTKHNTTPEKEEENERGKPSEPKGE
jgi:hypothetical protein